MEGEIEREREKTLGKRWGRRDKNQEKKMQGKEEGGVCEDKDPVWTNQAKFRAQLVGL